MSYFTSWISVYNLKRFFIWILFLATCVFYDISCKNTENRKRPKLKYPPPGTNYLKGNLFIDETEVSNMSWREYIYWTKKVYGAGSPEYIATLPDTLVWRDYQRNFKLKTNQDFSDIESLVFLYMRHPQYSHFPVVGVTHEQAAAFCAWRANRVNEVFYVNKHRDVTFPIDSSITIPKVVLFRLPSESEWEYAAKAGFDSSRFIDNSIDKYFYNTLEASYLREQMDSYDRFIPMVEMSLEPDKYNRYHLIGNVAEMINIKGVAKGGSYIHSLNDSYYTKRISYSVPNYWLGFRCICEILEK